MEACANTQAFDVAWVGKVPSIFPLQQYLGLVHSLQVIRNHPLEVDAPQVDASHLYVISRP